MYNDEYVETNSVHESINDSASEYSFSNDSSVASNIKKQRKLIEDAKLADKGFHRVYRKHADKNKKKKLKVEIYETLGGTGATIRNAVTGKFENGVRVGSNQTRLFFNIALCTGETGPSPADLYYNTPEECERHFHCTLTPEVKMKWLNAYIAESNIQQLRNAQKNARSNAYISIS